MHYTALLKNQIFLIEGTFYYDDKFILNTPWGEEDWQSGIERWRLTYYALFEGNHDIQTKISLIPEAINFIDVKSIKLENSSINFSALTIFRNNPYFSKEQLDVSKFKNNGFFADGNMKIIGKFKLIRSAEPKEVVTWIEDIDC